VACLPVLGLDSDHHPDMVILEFMDHWDDEDKGQWVFTQIAYGTHDSPCEICGDESRGNRFSVALLKEMI